MRIFSIIFISVMLVACNNDTSSQSSIIVTPSATPEVLPYSGVDNVTEIRSEFTSLPSYDNSSLATHLIYIPEDSSSTSALNVVISADGSIVSAKSVLSSEDVQQDIITIDNSSEDFFNKLRALEQEALQLNANRSDSDVLMKSIESTISSRTFVQGETWDDIGIEVDERYTSVVASKQSTYADIYVETGEIVSDAELQALADGFDQYYQAMITTFAEPLDVDGNGKIIIVLAKFQSSVMGYFFAVDKFPRDSSNLFTNYEYSNYADVFYINSTYLYDMQETIATLVHEFQHMLLFDYRYKNNIAVYDDTWINEGLSVLSEFLMEAVPNEDSMYLHSFFGTILNHARYSPIHSQLSLVNWDNLNYGYSGLFALYLHEQYPDFIKNFYSSNDGGIVGVENATGRNFNELFLDFAYALSLSNKGITDDPKYNYSTIDFNNYKYSNSTFDIGMQPYDGDVGNSYSLDIQPYGILSLSLGSGKATSISITPETMGLAYPWGN